MTCPLCQQTDRKTRWRQTDRLFRTTDKQFDIKDCPSCGVFFLSPLPEPEELSGYYPEGYWLGPPSGDDGDDDSGGKSSQNGGGLWTRLIEFYRRLVLRDHVRFVQRVITAQQARGEDVFLLDVGCGDGSFLGACAAPKSMGMDLSEGAVRHAKARGFPAVLGGLDAAPLQDRSSSLITRYHVLEHVYSVDDTLQTVRRLLRDGGDLVLQVPNAASYQAKLLGGRWAGLDVPRHLLDFTPRSLRAVLQKNGFEPVRETHFSIRDNPTTFTNSVAPGLYPPARAARQAGGVLADLAYLAITLGAIPFTLVESMLGHGAAVMIHARRVDE
jgi:SAM-dependent methyltransferase